jgi:hypothetical protein
VIRPTPGLLAAVLAVAAAAAGCTLKVTPPDDGAAADAGPAQTVGDQCNAIYTELCTQGINRCGFVTTLGECLQGDLPNCCTGSICSELSKSPASAVDACKSALDAEDCNGIANGVSPPACQGVPQKP